MDPLDWTQLNAEYLFRDEWLTARKDRCRTPQGKIVDPYYVLEYADWVNALALTREGQVVMVRQYRHGLRRTINELPGGCIDPVDVDPEAAIRRELLEETGYGFDQVERVCQISPNPSTQSNICLGFLATGGIKIGNQHLDPNEEIAVFLVTVNELIRMLQENELWQAMHVTTCYYALKKLGKLSLT
ncbi:MAG TPA: NUDIX hydrolase [Chitinophagaceae bacterium]|nr:NUDIX hydrolase [Chitinophagaceae bacterium]